MQTQDLVKMIYYAIDEKKASDIVLMNTKRVTMITDYFVIASGDNQNQMQAMADAVQEAMEKQGIHFRHIEGYPKNDWILMDYNDIIVHIFSKESRAFYDLDRIWRDSLIMSVDQVL